MLDISKFEDMFNLQSQNYPIKSYFSSEDNPIFPGDKNYQTISFIYIQ